MKELVRNFHQLELMRQSGEMTAAVLQLVMAKAKPGVSLKQLDLIADEEFVRLGGGASFKTVPNYHWATCLTVNDEVVHGIPREIVLKDGDILSIDLGAVYQGWHTDTAWTVVVGNDTDVEKRRFLEVGEQAMWAGINQAVEGKRVGDISSAMQQVVETAGYSVVRSLVGHGVGKSNHEPPEIPGFGKAGTGMRLKAGMTLAIEIIYNQGGHRVYLKDDGWTIATSDGSWSGLFEMTVIVGKKQPEVITS